MRFIEGLTPEEMKAHKVAIQRGYFPREGVIEWRENTFAGMWLWRYPKRTRAYEYFYYMIGAKEPTWYDINDATLRRYIEELRRNNLAPNSVRTICAELKAVINSAVSYNYIPSRNYQRILSVGKDASEATYLNWDELRRLHAYQPQDPIEQRVLAIFMISCLTGARHSDAERLTMESLNTETNNIHYVSYKNGTFCLVPAHEWLPEYLPETHYQRLDMPNPHLSLYNNVLRDICKRCDINETLTFHRKGKDETGPKYEFVSSHTARRSYATNLHLAGARIEDISKTMGHADVEITKRYIQDYSDVPDNIRQCFKR